MQRFKYCNAACRSLMVVLLLGGVAMAFAGVALISAASLHNESLSLGIGLFAAGIILAFASCLRVNSMNAPRPDCVHHLMAYYALWRHRRVMEQIPLLPQNNPVFAV